jgi:putative redox protein
MLLLRQLAGAILRRLPLTVEGIIGVAVQSGYDAGSETGVGPMKARVQWLDGRAFVGESGSGHAVVMDGAPEAGGRNIGVRPMEMLLLGLGGCTAFDVVMILERMRENVTALDVLLEAERAAEDPKVFTRVRLIYKLRGYRLKPANVERAINLSAEKYCSASIMFGKTATLEHTFEIVEEGVTVSA